MPLPSRSNSVDDLLREAFDIIYTENESTPKPPAKNKSLDTGDSPAMVCFTDSFGGPLTLFSKSRVQVFLNEEWSTWKFPEISPYVCDKARSYSPNTVFLFMTGNYDVQVDYYHQRIRGNQPTVDFVHFTQKRINNFIHLLKECAIPQRVVLVGALFPVVRSVDFIASLTYYGKFDKNEVCQFLYDPDHTENLFFASRRTRINMVEIWNTKMKQAALKNGYRYVDPNGGVFDMHKRLHPAFLDASIINFHISWERSIPLWIRRFAKYGISRSDIETKNLTQSRIRYNSLKKKKIIVSGYRPRE